LICIPHAGGGVASFRGWAERLHAAEVGIVQLPGRGSRLRDPLVQSLGDAATGVADAISGSFPRPTVLFGHSLGALIAFEAARRLRERGWPLLALFVSGRRGPVLADPQPAIAHLPTGDFVRQVRQRYDAVPDAVLADPEMMQLLVPGLRADFAMLENYRYEPGPPLPCPIVACGGSADPHASRLELEAWKSETKSRFGVHTFAGGHFYLHDEREAVTALIANQLSVLIGAMARVAGGLR
jgi:medium-chain acyl-[acyl-carrier-protein] hydrolase